MMLYYYIQLLPRELSKHLFFCEVLSFLRTSFFALFDILYNIFSVIPVLKYDFIICKFEAWFCGVGFFFF